MENWFFGVCEVLRGECGSAIGRKKYFLVDLGVGGVGGEFC